MDEIFNRWINDGNILQDDIIPIMIKYTELFGTRTLTPSECVYFLQCVQMPMGHFLNKMLKYIGIKMGYNWLEVYDRNENFIRRFWNESK